MKLSGIRASRLEAKRLLATERLGTKPGAARGPLATAFRTLVRGPGKALAAGFKAFVGSAAPAPVAALPTPVSPGSVSENSSPAEVEAAMVALTAWDKNAMDRLSLGDRAVAAIQKAEAVSAFIDAVAKIDPSGKIVEDVESGSPDQQRHAARIIGGILAGLSTPAAAGSPAPRATSRPELHGLDRTLAAFKAELAAREGRASRPSPTPVRATTPAAAPLHGLALVESAFRAGSAGIATPPRPASEPRPLFGIARAEAAFRNSK